MGVRQCKQLLEFYSSQFAPQPFNADRLLFWSWVKMWMFQKLHYSAPQRVINQMKSLLFSQELDINIDTGNKSRDKELTKRFR